MSRWVLLLLATSFLHCLSPSFAFASSSMSDASPADHIAVIGCGVLGTSLCRQLLESPDFADRKVKGITKTTKNHESIRTNVGAHHDNNRFEVVTGEELKGQLFRDVVFCAPPSGFDDYPAAVQDAATNIWDQSAGGVFVFTSSGGVYGDTANGGVVTEETPIGDINASPRVARLAAAEEASLSNGGCVLRLAGLYTLERGAHNYWMTSGKDVAGRSDGIINLLHYDDAAGACMAALKAEKVVNGKVFLISDGNPLTRHGICESAKKANMYKDSIIPKFLGTDSDSKGKVYNGSYSNSVLQWSPKYPSFDEFMASQS